VLCAAVGAQRPGLYLEAAVRHWRGEIHGQRHRLTQPCRVLQHRVQQLRGRHAAIRAHHVGEQRAGAALVAVLACWLQGEGVVEGVEF